MVNLTAASLPSRPLGSLSPGQVAYVVNIDQGHPLRRRLLELGFIRGARVVWVRQAPLGDPVQLRLGRTDLALRRADLQGIWVRPEEQDQHQLASVPQPEQPIQKARL